MKYIPHAIAVYAAVGIIAFGHSSANTKGCANLSSWKSVSECRSGHGMMAGFFWPLYLSWMAFENEPEDKPREEPKEGY